MSGQSGLFKHQWLKHGSCSHLSVDTYIAEGERLMKTAKVLEIEALLAERSASFSISTEELEGKVGPSGVVSATPWCQLKEISLCFEKTKDGNKVGDAMACPPVLTLGDRANAGKRCQKLVVDQRDQCQNITTALKTLLQGGK